MEMTLSTGRLEQTQNDIIVTSKHYLRAKIQELIHLQGTKSPTGRFVRSLRGCILFFQPFGCLLLLFCVDAMTIGFKGQHTDKRQITYKAEGDGFQTDALYQNGFTYHVYMRNDRAPTKYLMQGLSPPLTRDGFI